MRKKLDKANKRTEMVLQMTGANRNWKKCAYLKIKELGFIWNSEHAINPEKESKDHDYEVLYLDLETKRLTFGYLEYVDNKGVPIFTTIKAIEQGVYGWLNLYTPEYRMIERMKKLVRESVFGKAPDKINVVELPITTPEWKLPSSALKMGYYSKPEEGEVKVKNIEEPHFCEQVDGNDVSHQDHYVNQGIEPIEYMRANFSKEAFRGFLHGNIQKYLTRHEKKNKLEDLLKAKVYLQWLIEDWEER